MRSPNECEDREQSLKYLTSFDAACSNREIGIARRQEQPQTSKGVALDCSCRRVLSSRGTGRTEACIDMKSGGAEDSEGEREDKHVGGGCGGDAYLHLFCPVFKRP